MLPLALQLNVTAEVGINRFRSPVLNQSEESTISTPRYGNIYEDLPIYAQIAIAIYCIVLIVPAIIGNVLVLYTFCTISRLRRYNNYYLVSLAFCDLVGGVLIMPFYGTYWVLGYWPFGRLICEIYKFINHVFTQATFLSVFVIAVDRYRALRYPIRHLQEQTAKHAMIMISSTYVIPLMIWSPLKLVQNFSDAISYVRIEKHCLPFYSTHLSLVITVSLLTLLPMVLTTIIYIKVYRIARKARARTNMIDNLKKKTKVKHQGRLYRRPSRCNPDQPIDETEITKSTQNLCSAQSPKPPKIFKRSFSTGVRFNDETCFINPIYDSSTEENHIEKSGRRLTRYLSAEHLFKRPPSLAAQGKQLSFKSSKNESSRATKTLTLTYFAMILSGLPWTIIAIISQFCMTCFPKSLSQVRTTH